MSDVIVFLAVDWQSRALIRAQLIEEGFDVIAIDSWTEMRRELKPGSKPRVALVDLKDLPDPVAVLDELRVLMKPESVLVLSAIGTAPSSGIERLGFRMIRRPFLIEDVVRAVWAIWRGTP